MQTKRGTKLSQSKLARSVAPVGSVLALAVYGFSSPASGSTSFIDNLTTSTLNSASQSYSNTPTPTSTSTNYDVASSTASTYSAINNGTGDLTLKLNSGTTSGFEEIQAVFSSDPTPFALTNTGDTIEYDVTFTDTAGLMAGGTSSNIMMGLYNTNGGAAPYNSINNTTLLSTATGSSVATGGTVNWEGYAAIFVPSGTNSKINTRPAQTNSATSSANQELLGNNFGGGAYANPAGAQLTGASNASSISLTTGNTYTADMLITLLASGQLSIVNTLYSGTGTGGTALGSVTGTTTATTELATSFDGLAFGARNSGTSNDPTADITGISVVYTAATSSMPEPACLTVLGLGGMALLGRRRRGAVTS